MNPGLLRVTALDDDMWECSGVPDDANARGTGGGYKESTAANASTSVDTAAAATSVGPHPTHSGEGIVAASPAWHASRDASITQHSFLSSTAAEDSEVRAIIESTLVIMEAESSMRKACTGPATHQSDRFLWSRCQRFRRLG